VYVDPLTLVLHRLPIILRDTGKDLGPKEEDTRPTTNKRNGKEKESQETKERTERTRNSRRPEDLRSTAVYSIMQRIDGRGKYTSGGQEALALCSAAAPKPQTSILRAAP
jgi:hypothetical protein